MAYPEHVDALREIAQAHREQEVDEPLLLALYYADDKHPGFDNMLEVYNGYDMNRVNDDRQMLTTAFGTAGSGFPVIQDVNLRLIITNPVELAKALDENWDGIEQIRSAIDSGSYKTVLTDQLQGPAILKLLMKGTAVA